MAVLFDVEISLVFFGQRVNQRRDLAALLFVVFELRCGNQVRLKGQICVLRWRQLIIVLNLEKFLLIQWYQVILNNFDFLALWLSLGVQY